MEAKIARLKDLLSKRDEIDAELGQLLGVEKKERKPQACGNCGEEGHSARTCPKPKDGLPAVAM